MSLCASLTCQVRSDGLVREDHDLGVWRTVGHDQGAYDVRILALARACVPASWDDGVIINAGEVTEQLLAFLRDPPRILNKVHEQMGLDANELTRTVTCTFDDVAGPTLVVDLLRPRKGDIPRLEVLESTAKARRLTHEEHGRLAKELLALRFSKLLDSIRLDSDDAEDAARLSEEMIAALHQLTALPDLDEHRANAVLAKLWVPANLGSDALMVLAPMASRNVICDVQCLSLLRQLCQMLATRYLALVELSGIDGRQVELKYCYHHAVSQSPDRPRAVPIRPLSKEMWRTVANRYLRRYPTSVRIHIPLAKKAVHYSAEVTAAPSFFFWRAGALADPSPDSNSAMLQAPESARWSSTLHNGRCAALFLQKGSEEAQRLYLATQLAEDSNLSAAHNAVITSFITMVFFMFAGFAAITDRYNAAWGALIVAVLGLAIGLVRDHFENPGILRTPLQSIAIRIFIAYSIAIYAGWLVSLGSTFEGHGFASWVFDRWLQFGGLALAIAMLGVSVAAWRRFIEVLTKYQIAVTRRGDQVHLYDNKEIWDNGSTLSA